MCGDSHALVWIPKRQHPVTDSVCYGVTIGEPKIVEIINRGIKQESTISQEADNQYKQDIAAVARKPLESSV